MDKDQKKIKYQELFLSELRNSKFGEKKIEEALNELETKTNMNKLARALKNIWKKTDENVKELESVFPKAERNVPVQAMIVLPEVKTKLDFEPINDKSMETRSKKRRLDISDLKDLKVVSYDHLVELVDDLSLEDVTEILTSVAGQEKNDHQYLAGLAEKLLKGKDVKKIPDSKA